jgi:hypothetical protein
MPLHPVELESEEVLRGDAAMREVGRFFMQEGKVYNALRAITAKLDELQIPYAVVEGMALAAHGHTRTTDDVDILVTSEGLQRIHQELEGLGYVPPFAGSKHLKDVQNKTKIEFLVAGQYPGDGKAKPIAFPDPANASVEIDGIRYLGLRELIELKLASGMTGGSDRIQDFADVVALVRLLKLPLDFSNQLNPYVRTKYQELWLDMKPAQE